MSVSAGIDSSDLEPDSPLPSPLHRSQCGVCYRSHCAAGQSTPLLAVLNASERWVESASVRVVASSAHAVFGDDVYIEGSAGRHSALLNMQVGDDAPALVTIKLVFQLKALVLSEVTFEVHVNTTAAASRKKHDSWKYTSAEVFRSLYVVVCSDPGHMQASRILSMAVQESVAALPEELRVVVREASTGVRGWLHGVLASAKGSSKVQLVAVAGDEGLETALQSPIARGAAMKAVTVCRYSADNIAEADCGPVRSMLWMHSAAPSIAASAQRFNFLAAHEALLRKLSEVKRASPGPEAPLGCVLLPELPVEGGLASTTAAVRDAVLRSLSGLAAHFSLGSERSERPQHNEDSSLSATMSWRLYFLSDTVPWPAKSWHSALVVAAASSGDVARSLRFRSEMESALRTASVPVKDVPPSVLCKLLPLLRSTLAFAAAQTAGSEHAVQLRCPYAVRGLSRLCDVDMLAVLADIYSTLHFHSESLAPLHSSSLERSLHDVAVRTESTVPSLALANRLLEEALLSWSKVPDRSICLSALEEVFIPARCDRHGLRQLEIDGVPLWVANASMEQEWEVLHEISVSEGNLSEPAGKLLIAYSPLIKATQMKSSPNPCSPSQHRDQGQDALLEQLVRAVAQEAGVKDPSSAREAAECLIGMGCASYSDFVLIGAVFADPTTGSIAVDKLRVFLHEGGIPLFIAAKLAAFIQKKLSH